MFKISECKKIDPLTPIIYSYKLYTVNVSFTNNYNIHRYKLQFMAKNENIARGTAVNYVKEFITGPTKDFKINYVNVIDVKELDDLIHNKQLITCEKVYR